MLRRRAITSTAQIGVIYAFSAINLFEICSFGLGLLSISGEVYPKPVFMFTTAIFYSNIYLVEGILQRRVIQLLLYSVLYVYTASMIFCGHVEDEGRYLALKITQVCITGLRGLIICMYFRQFRYEFWWDHAVINQADQKLKGKCYF